MKPVLYAQAATPTVEGAKTLANAVLWNCEVTLDVEQATTAVRTLNDDAPSASSPRMEVTPPAAGKSGPQCVTFERLHVLHAQRARVDVEGVTFPEPLQPILRHTTQITIGGTRAPLATHIATMLHDLTSGSPFASHALSMECYYSYPALDRAVSPDVPVLVPVLLVTRQEVASSSMTTLAGQCADAIEEWRRTNCPPTDRASLVFRVIFWPAGAIEAAPLLDLTNVALYVSDLEAWT